MNAIKMATALRYRSDCCFCDGLTKHNMNMKQKSNIFLSLMEELDVPHTDNYTVRAYEEHPYKYTFYGLKSLCEKYGVQADGVRIDDKAEITRLTTPFVADYANDYVLVKGVSSDRAEFEIYGATTSVLLDDFKEGWGGHALLFRTDEKSAEPDYKAHKCGNLVSTLEWFAIALAAVCILCFCASFRAVPTWVEVLSLALTLLGGAFSVMLLSQQLKVRNSFVESVCHAFKKSSCNNVLESKAAKILGRYSWSEIGFSYFTVNFVCLLLSANFTPILAYVGVLALPYSLWSIWYQRRISQWCPLCLMVQGVLWLQFLAFLISGAYAKLHIEFEMTLLFAASGFLMLFGINRLLQLITTSRKATQWKYAYRRLKAQREVFEALLHAQSYYKVEESSCLLFGDEAAEHTVTVYGNPYCAPCARMHRRLLPLLDEGFAIRYVFTYFSPKLKQINKKIVAAYHQYGSERTWQLLSEWYDKGESQNTSFFKRLGEKSVLSFETEKEVDRQWEWGHRNGLAGTPTLIVDGYAIPEHYEVEDLAFIY